VNKHITITVSLPPDLKELLESWVTPELSRSEIVGKLIQAHAARPAAVGFKDVPLFVAELPADTQPTGATVRVLSVKVPGSLHWKSERMAQVEELLGHGPLLTRRGHVWHTVQGAALQNRAVEALTKTGNLAP
jgi:hypothetical protein